MKATNIFIVEDMAISRASLESILVSNGYKISGSVAKAEKAWQELQNSDTDIVLIDINLAGEKNGIWLANQIREHLNLPFIYLTAYGDQQTLKEVLHTKPYGYLMKPYQEPTLISTLHIALTNFRENQLLKTPKPENDEKNYLFIKERYIRVKLNIQEVYYIKSEGNYLEIKLEHKTYVVRNKLSEFHKELPQDQFIQCHRRYIVNIHQIDMLGKDFVSILGEDIPTATKYRMEIENKLSIL